MISSSNKVVKIYITTYKTDHYDKNKKTNTMERRHEYNMGDNRHLCSICFNKNNYNNDCDRRLAKACPICRIHYNCDKKNKRNDDSNHKDITVHRIDRETGRSNKEVLSNNFEQEQETYRSHKDAIVNSFDQETNCSFKDVNTKLVQTSQTDLTQDLSLLKEVLTVFQSKKQIDIKTNSQCVLMKDVSVETETKSKTELKTKLTMSRTFQFSIEEGCKNHGTHFKIVNYSQPYNSKASQLSIDLIKHKSSSIPQMKLEELKYSLKEKSKSKDAIEEVNRMFATVKRSNDLPIVEEQNRPMIRNGPRVLPVVKTNNYQDCNKKDNSDHEEAKKLPDEKIKSYHSKENSSENEKPTCKCCQTNNIQLSGGDSFIKHECCYHKMFHEGRCEKCVYMLCCHYQKHNQIETGALMCECCKGNEDHVEKCDVNSHCDHF